MNTKDVPEIGIVIRMKLLNAAGKQITTLTGMKRKLLIRKAGYSQEDQRNHIFFEES